MTILEILQLVPLFAGLFWLGSLSSKVTSLQKDVIQNSKNIKSLSIKVDVVELMIADIREIKTNLNWVIKAQEEINKKLKQ